MPTLKELFDLSGKIALVTGGSRGLGKEMAEGLAEAGADLMILARREQWLAPQLKRFALAALSATGFGDVAARRESTASIKHRYFGQIDILINNEASPEGRPREMRSTNGRWLDINRKGAFCSTREGPRELKARRENYQCGFNRGSERNDGAREAHPRLSAAKGMISMTRELEQGARPARVNAIARVFSFAHDEKCLNPRSRRSKPLSLWAEWARGELKGVAVFLASPASATSRAGN